MLYAEKNGKGIGIAFLDTGIFPHPDFGRRIVAFKDFVYGRAYLNDVNGHGTHVTGIAAGSGSLSQNVCCGTAKEAEIIALKVLDDKGNGQIYHFLQALDWIERNKERYHIRIINISVGTIDKKNSYSIKLNQAVEYMWDRGFTVVAAAGNLGPKPGSIASPGSSRKIITVGCCDMPANHPSSGIGPTNECICKPDVVASGFQILSCANNYGKYPYTKKSGTSMATPYVSGAIACLLQADNYLTNVEVKMLLKNACIDIGLPRNIQGWGKFSIEKFLK